MNKLKKCVNYTEELKKIQRIWTDTALQNSCNSSDAVRWVNLERDAI